MCPGGRVRQIKRAFGTFAWRFSADRMVLDYANTFYVPAVGQRDVEDSSRIALALYDPAQPR